MLCNMLLVLARKGILKWLKPEPFNLMLWIPNIRNIVDTVADIYTLLYSSFIHLFHIYSHCPSFCCQGLRLRQMLFLQLTGRK